RESKYCLIRRTGLSLNNGGDDLVLSDLTGGIIDSLHYLPNWHNADIASPAGRSLERINPEIGSSDRRNWSTSASPDGGTPGKQNSLLTMIIPGTAGLSAFPNPFSPDG